jgi:hypothetical protein
MADRPLWRRAFDAVDHGIGRPIEAVTRTDAFGDAFTIAWRLQRRMQKELERRSRRALHLCNLPAASDVRRLSEQVGALQRQVRELSHELEKER